MPNTYTDRAVESLIINKMTQAQYDALPEKSDTELYLIDGGESSMFAEQMIVMPTASEAYINRIVQFVGNTTMEYTTGYFYRCVLQGAQYVWKKINVQTSQGGGGGSGQEIQFEEFPEATSENVGQIIQYVGETVPDVCEKGYFYINQPTYSDPTLSIEQTGGQTDSISFEVISGNIEISGTVDAIRNLFYNYIGGQPTEGTITITWNTPYAGCWYFAIHDSTGEHGYNGTQNLFEENGFTFSGTPVGGEEIECSYTAGDIYNVSFWDENQFIEMEQPTQSEIVTFIAAGGSPVSAEAYIEHSDDPELTVSINAETYNQFITNFCGDPYIAADCFGNASFEFYQEEDWEDEETGEFYPGESYWILHGNWDQIEWIAPEDLGISIDSGYTMPGDVISISFYQEGEASWTKDGSEVLLDEYGIHYDGFARAGDEISVTYTAAGISGYEWEQVNVQPGGGADKNWKTIIDIPTGITQWVYPQYNFGKVPDGRYEVYTQIKTSTGGTASYATYKWNIELMNNGQYYKMFGSYVLDGSFAGDSNFKVGEYCPMLSNSLWRNNLNELVFGAVDWTNWASDMPAYYPNYTAQEGNAICKITSLKNIDTGKEYVATGKYFLGSQDTTGLYQINGSNYNIRFIEFPQESRYALSGVFPTNSEYIAIYSIYIPNKRIPQPNVDYCKISCYKDGDYFDAEIKFSQEKYEARILRATGSLAGMQLGYNTNDWNQMLHIKKPVGVSDINYFISIGGNVSVPFNFYISSAGLGNNFTPLIISKVGCPVTKDNFGTIEQYTGETNQDYTNGYFYKATGTIVPGPEELSIYNTSPNDFTVTITNVDAFINALSSYMGWSANDIKNRFKYYNSFVIYYDMNQQAVTYFNWSGTTNTTSQNLLQYITAETTGTYSGTVGIAFNMDYIPEGTLIIQNPHWEQVNVQPGGGGSGPVYPSTMPILAGDAWEEDQQTGELTQTLSNISEVTANNVVMVSPSPVSAGLYAECGVLCVAQGNGSLTFKCDTLPDDDITVTLVCF